MSVSIKITGLEPLMNKLNKLDRLEPVLRPVLKRGQDKIQRAAKKYPAPPPGSKYVRTFKLQRSWRQKPPQFMSGGFRAEVFSDGSAKTKYGEYAPFVMDAHRQARVHRGRWQTTKSIAEDFEDEIRDDIHQAIKRELNK